MHHWSRPKSLTSLWVQSDMHLTGWLGLFLLQSLKFTEVEVTSDRMKGKSVSSIFSSRKSMIRWLCSMQTRIAKSFHATCEILSVISWRLSRLANSVLHLANSAETESKVISRLKSSTAMKYLKVFRHSIRALHKSSRRVLSETMSSLVSSLTKSLLTVGWSSEGTVSEMVR